MRLQLLLVLNQDAIVQVGNTPEVINQEARKCLAISNRPWGNLLRGANT